MRAGTEREIVVISMRNKELIKKFKSGSKIVETQRGLCGTVKYVDKNDMIRIEVLNGRELIVTPELLEVRDER